MAQQKFRLPNKTIVWMKLISALGLFFSCCLYVFLNFQSFVRDLGFDQNARLGTPENPWYNLAFPIFFILGLCFIIYYITNMIIRFETKEIWKADRLFVLYQVVYTTILVITIVRWFFVNAANLLIPSVIMIISGFINIVTPKIVDNDNTDF